MLNSGQSVSLLNNKVHMEKHVLKIPSETKYIRKISSEIVESIAHHKVEEEKIFDIRLSVEEAVRNAIIHGNHSDKKKSVRISYWIEHHHLVIEVEDEGSGFDHKLLPNPTEKDNIMRNSGRGVYLIHRLMDKLEYSEKGNRLKMTKYLGKKEKSLCQ